MGCSWDSWGAHGIHGMFMGFMGCSWDSWGIHVNSCELCVLVGGYSANPLHADANHKI